MVPPAICRMNSRKPQALLSPILPILIGLERNRQLMGALLATISMLVIHQCSGFKPVGIRSNG